MVFGYFAKSLTNQFGEMKTSFLRNIGVGLVTNINYITILDDANDFLKTVSMDNNNNYVFETLFNKKFGNRRTIVTSNGPFGLYGSEALSRLRTGSSAVYAPMAQIYLSYLRYPNPSLNNVNFYSFVYYLIHEIDYGNGIRNQISKKLLTDIILRRFDKAKQLIHKNSKRLIASFTAMPKPLKFKNRYSMLVKKLIKLVKHRMMKYPKTLPAGYKKPEAGIMYLPYDAKGVIIPYPPTKEELAKFNMLKNEINLYTDTFKTGGRLLGQKIYRKMNTIKKGLNYLSINFKFIEKRFALFQKMKTSAFWKNPKAYQLIHRPSTLPPEPYYIHKP